MAQYYNRPKYNRPNYRDKFSEKYRRNTWITANELRVISETGEQLGVITKADALQRAYDAGLDLIEVAPKAEPPVARIESWSKFKYEISKRERLSKKKSKQQTTKEMWFAPMIGPGDLDHKIKRVIEFLEERHMVKLTIKIPGRLDRQLAFNLMKVIIEKLADKGTPEGFSKNEGRSIIQLIKPK